MIFNRSIFNWLLIWDKARQDRFIVDVKNSKVRLMFLIVVLVAVTSCATSNTSYSVLNDETLENGNIRLGCGVMCSGTWGIKLSSASSMHNQENWRDLAKLVAEVGFKQDLTYYYLGRSAEGLGMKNAALTYYEQAATSDMKCSQTLNLCDGMNIPATIELRMEIVKKLKATSPSLTAHEKRRVKRAQSMLNDMGYLAGSPDGIIGAQTRSAARKFQADNDLKITGAIDTSTYKQIELSHTSADHLRPEPVGTLPTRDDGKEVFRIPESTEVPAPYLQRMRKLLSDAEVMEDPDIFSNAVESIRSGEMVNTLSAEGEWYKVEYRGKSGYILQENFSQ